MAPRATTASAATPMSRGAGLPPAVGTGVTCTAMALGDADTVSVSAAAKVGEALCVGDAVAASVGGAVGGLVGGAVGGAVGAAVGAAVRTGVGSGVDGGGVVGGAVGGGVGAGVFVAMTVTVPVMNAWIAQWYANVPALAKVIEPEPPAAMTPVSQVPVFEVAVWLNASALVHLTASPARIVVDGGLNAEF
jgi:hypothetical protein